MAGNTANAHVWAEADVLVAPLGTALPVGNAAFDPDDWSFVGLLNGGNGFEEGLEVQSTDHNAWGYGIIATTYRGQKTTKTFTALEDNETVLGLVYDVSDVTFSNGGYTGELKMRDMSEQVLVAFVTRSGAVEQRMITANYGTIAPTAGTSNEEALSSRAFTVTVVPTDDKALWVAYKGAPATGGA